MNDSGLQTGVVQPQWSCAISSVPKGFAINNFTSRRYRWKTAVWVPRENILFFAKFNQQNTQYSAWDIRIISHWILLHNSIHKGRSSGNHNKAISHKTKPATFIHISHSVRESNTYKNVGSFFCRSVLQVYWILIYRIRKQPTYLTKVSNF